MRPEELTPTEVGRLVNFLKMHVLQAVTAVERAMARLEVLREKEDPGHALALSHSHRGFSPVSVRSECFAEPFQRFSNPL